MNWIWNNDASIAVFPATTPQNILGLEKRVLLNTELLSENIIPVVFLVKPTKVNMKNQRWPIICDVPSGGRIINNKWVRVRALRHNGAIAWTEKSSGFFPGWRRRKYQDEVIQEKQRYSSLYWFPVRCSEPCPRLHFGKNLINSFVVSCHKNTILAKGKLVKKEQLSPPPRSRRTDAPPAQTWPSSKGRRTSLVRLKGLWACLKLPEGPDGTRTCEWGGRGAEEFPPQVDSASGSSEGFQAGVKDE